MFNEILTIIIVVIALGVIVYFVSGNLKRVLQVVSGWGIYQSLGFFYDYILWGYIQYEFALWGSIFMSVMSLIINIFLLKWYTRKDNDWLGVNIIEDLKRNGYKKIDRILKNRHILLVVIMYIPIKIFDSILWMLKKNDILAFFVMSIWQDPFMTTVFLRHGKNGPVTHKDYHILLTSTVVTSLYWIVFIEVILQILEKVMHF